MAVTDKKLPVGIDDFEKLIRNGYYYKEGKINFSVAIQPEGEYNKKSTYPW